MPAVTTPKQLLAEIKLLPDDALLTRSIGIRGIPVSVLKQVLMDNINEATQSDAIRAALAKAASIGPTATGPELTEQTALHFAERAGWLVITSPEHLDAVILERVKHILAGVGDNLASQVSHAVRLSSRTTEPQRQRPSKKSSTREATLLENDGPASR